MSAPTLEHAPSTVEHLDQLSQADLLGRRDVLESEIARYDEELTGYVNHLKESGDPEYSILEQLDDDQYSEDNDNEDHDSSYHYLIEHGEGLLSPYLLETLSILAKLIESDQSVEDQLDTRFAPGLMQYARDEALELYSNLDFVAVGKLEKGKSPDLPDSDGIRLRENEETLPHPELVVFKLGNIAYDEHADPNYRYAEMMVDEIERCKEILERWGVGIIKPLTKPVYDHTELERAEELNNRYRHYHKERSAVAAGSEPLLPVHEWGVNLPEVEVAKYYEHLASIDIEKELERIKIDGLELLPFEFTDTELRDYIRTHIPAIALEGLNNIVFRNATDEEKVRDSLNATFDGQGVTVGHHDHNLSENSAEIVIFTDKFQKFYDEVMAWDPNKAQAEWGTKKAVLETLAHELGHALHHTLPVSMLHEWDVIADGEKVEVNAYVTEMNKLDHINRYKEDFAVSFSLYANKPVELSSKASERYAKMQALVTKLKPAA